MPSSLWFITEGSVNWVFLESRGKECEGRAGGREVGMGLIRGRSLPLELRSSDCT